jgi:hypothetical protein
LLLVPLHRSVEQTQTNNSLFFPDQQILSEIAKRASSPAQHLKIRPSPRKITVAHCPVRYIFFALASTCLIQLIVTNGPIFLLARLVSAKRLLNLVVANGPNFFLAHGQEQVLKWLTFTVSTSVLLTSKKNGLFSAEMILTSKTHHQPRLLFVSSASNLDGFSRLWERLC